MHFKQNLDSQHSFSERVFRPLFHLVRKRLFVKVNYGNVNVLCWDF